MEDSSNPTSSQHSPNSEKSGRQSPGQNSNPEADPINSVFNPEEVQNLNDIFGLFDKDKTGKIETTHLENILSSLKRDPEEAKQMLAEIDQNHSGLITFPEFVSLMAKIENKIDSKPLGDDALTHDGSDDNLKGDPSKRTTIKTDSRVLEFLVLLENHRSQ